MEPQVLVSYQHNYKETKNAFKKVCPGGEGQPKRQGHLAEKNGTDREVSDNSPTKDVAAFESPG